MAARSHSRTSAALTSAFGSSQAAAGGGGCCSRAPSTPCRAGARRARKLGHVEGFGFGGDPEDLLRGIREFAAQQAETVAEAQREQFATLTLNTAVELTGAALKRMEVSGT